MNDLIGKKVKSMKIAKDKQAVLFETECGLKLEALVDADCCSYTWIESIELPAKGFPFEIISIDNLEMPDLGDMPGCECVSYYGAKITTTSGDLVIDYRNDSNGFYGGSIYWPGDEYFYGGVFGQNVSDLEWEEIQE